MADEKKPISVVSIQERADRLAQAMEGDLKTPDTEVIEYLEFLLKEARQGEIQEVCFAYRYWDGVTFDSHFTGYGELPEAMVGTLHKLIGRYSKFYDDEDEEE